MFTGCSDGARICPRRGWSLEAGGSRQAGQTPALRASPVVAQVVMAAGTWGSVGGATACC